MGGIRASKRRSAKRLSLARSLDDLEVGVDPVSLPKSPFLLTKTPRKCAFLSGYVQHQGLQKCNYILVSIPLFQTPGEEIQTINPPTPSSPWLFFFNFSFPLP